MWRYVCYTESSKIQARKIFARIIYHVSAPLDPDVGSSFLEWMEEGSKRPTSMTSNGIGLSYMHSHLRYELYMYKDEYIM